MGFLGASGIFCYGQGCWRSFEGLEGQSKLLAAEHLRYSMPMDVINPSAYFMSIITKVARGSSRAVPLSTPSIMDDLHLPAQLGMIYRPRPDEPQRSPLNGRGQAQHGRKVPFVQNAADMCNNVQAAIFRVGGAQSMLGSQVAFRGGSQGLQCGWSPPPEE